MRMQKKKEIKKRLDKISNFIGINKFILYGSSAKNVLFGKKIYSDLDIIVPLCSKGEFSNIIAKLTKNNFKIISNRIYKIQFNTKIKIINAIKDNQVVEISFLRNPKWIGIFDIESLYISYPEIKIINKSKTLNAIKRKNIKLIRSISKENPLIIASRFFKICSENNIKINQKDHLKFIKELREKLINNKIKDKRAYISFISRLLNSILKNKRRKKFLKEILETKMISEISKELDKSLKKVYKKDIKFIKKKEELIKILMKISNKKMQKKLILLKERKWDLEDVQAMGRLIKFKETKYHLGNKLGL